MSDYLSNLAARSLKQAEVVQPRPASRFAPSPHLKGWPSAERRADLEIVDQEQALEADGGPTTPPLQSYDQRLECRLATVSQPVVEPMLPTSQPRRQPTPILPVERREIESVVSPAPPSQLQPPVQAGPGPISPIERVVVDRVSTAPSPPLPAERVVIERIGMPAPHPLSVTRADPLAQHPPVLAPLAEEVEIERVITSAPATPAVIIHQSPPNLPAVRPVSAGGVIAQPQVVSAPRREPAQPDPVRPEPAPVIQVTIGRIEVRATPPATRPARSARTTPPVMSLEEYLRGRNGGSR